MMRVSTRGRYALRAMVDLALHADGEPVSRQDIAGRQGISADYVAQLFRRLHAAGLVEGVKGPGGGYLLARDTANITAGDVVRAVEGPLAVVYCALPGNESACNRVDRCATHLLWKRLSAVMTEFLDSVTLQDLCDEARQLQEEVRGNGKDIQ
jgi:Rrf2 family iron-sulfur cluster assembly transcriptional regulator